MPSTDLIQAMGRYNEELAEAVEWVKHSPNPMPSEIEIRPIFERGTEMPTRMDCASQVLQGLRSSVIF